MQEAEVRRALLRRFDSQVQGDHTRVIHELDLCQAAARIDVAAVNGHLTGWEIKTDRDTLARLPRQEEVYSRVFDRVWLVAAPKHLAAGSEMVPAWWGLAYVDSPGEDARVRVVRNARRNPSVDLQSLVRLLWRSETLHELERLGLAAGYERAPRRLLWERLASASPRYLSRTALKERVRWHLKYREGWRSDVRRTSGGGSS